MSTLRDQIWMAWFKRLAEDKNVDPTMLASLRDAIGAENKVVTREALHAAFKEKKAEK